MPIYAGGRGWSAAGGPVASVASTTADQTLLSFVIPAGIINNIGEAIAFSWRGQMIQNIDANQTFTLAAQVGGTDVIRKQGPTFINSATGKHIIVSGEVKKLGTSSLMAFLDMQLMASNQSLAGSEVGAGSLLSPTFNTRTFGTATTGVSVDWGADITFSVLMAMLTASASYSFQGFGWHAEKLGI